MKTRDEQAWDYINSMPDDGLALETNDLKNTFESGWDAALASQWRDAEEELPTDSTDRDYIVRVEFNDGSGFCQSTAGYPDNHWCVFDRIISNEIEEGKCRITHWMPIPDLGFEEEQ